MAPKKPGFNPVLMLPIVLVLVIVSSVLFGLFYKGGMPLAGTKPSPSPSPEPAAEATPEPAAERLFAFKSGKKWGFKDQTGEVRIEAQYEKALDFSEGKAFVAVDTAGAWRYGLIDEKGGVLIDPQYADARQFKNGFAPIKFADSWGYVTIDSAGAVKLAIDPAYSSAGDFSEGYAKVSKDGKFGYIDTNGSVVIGFEYLEAQDFSEGYAIVGDKDPSGVMRYHVLKPDGTPAASLGTEYGSKYSEGFLAVRVADKKYVFYDKMFKNAFGDKTFEAALSFSEGLAAVKEGGKWGYINSTGDYLIQPKYEDAKEFMGGMAAVKLDGKWGYIDSSSGTFAISNRYDEAYSFQDGYAVVRKDTSMLCVSKDGFDIQLYVLDDTGAASGESPAGQARTGKVTLSKGSLNVRETPDAAGKKVTELANGSIVTITGSEGDWLAIQIDDKQGYCLAKYITEN